MGACGSRLQRKQQELTATTSRARRGSASSHYSKHRGSSGSSSGSSTGSRSCGSTTAPPPPVCRSTASTPASTTATTSTSTSPKPHAAPATGGNGLLSRVPVEILRGSIYPFLGAVCLARAGCACRSWGEASVDEHLWKALCLKRWVGKHVGERGVKALLAEFFFPHTYEVRRRRVRWTKFHNTKGSFSAAFQSSERQRLVVHGPFKLN